MHRNQPHSDPIQSHLHEGNVYECFAKVLKGEVFKLGLGLLSRALVDDSHPTPCKREGGLARLR